MPMLMWATGFVSGLDGKTAFMIGHIVNQISEFSLIIANIAVGMGIFTDTMYLTIVIGTLITFILSSMGHVHADAIYDKGVSKVLGPCMDARSWIKDDHVEPFDMQHHVVILGFNEIALEIAEYFRITEKKAVLLLQDNPALHQTIKSLYMYDKKANTQTNPHLSPSPIPGVEGVDGGGGTRGLEEGKSEVASNIFSQYANPSNPDTWHHYGLHDAALVVSCQQGTTESDTVLGRELLHHHVPFLCIADSNNEARVMYASGVRYVFQSESLAASAFKHQMWHEPLHKDRFMKHHALSYNSTQAENIKSDSNLMLLAQYL